MNVFQKVFPVGWVLMACLGSSAALAAAQPTPAQDAAQQVVLQQQRAQVQAEYAAQRGACLQRFFVNDCLDAAREKERAALAPIDTDLQAIALRGRLRAAEDELRRVQANRAASQRGQPDRAQAEQQSAAREADLAQRQQQAAQRAAQAAAAPPKTPATAAAPVPTPAGRLFPAPAPQSQKSPAQRAAEVKQAEADFAAKQKAYAEKQAEQARQNAAKPSTAPLPVPPPSAP
ncbi:MAG TPA: hypothetical protein PKE37_09565 [Thiomonas arsenitoxydans]|uniref:hypothetical protein n=1 Tax=Thiomonas TaxID=32012 RepID=UPI00257F0564|nr:MULTISPECIES: hypothetical protein [Thiomonas]HML81999.1 hypothetical protein [Thiomonas arsenitoxydans]